jgi:YbgC/YbaW family acyl-CoA thioester hydrolase
MTTEEEVMFYDTDIGGVIHNLAYLRMIERCRTLLATEIGFNLATMARDSVYPVVVRTEIDYRRPGTLGDRLLTKGHISRWGKVRFSCAFEMRRASDSELLVECRQDLAVVSMPGGKIRRLDDPALGLRPLP